MQPPGVGEVVVRVALVDDHVADQGGTTVHTLEKVVAEHGALRHRVSQAGLEGGHVVEALAGIDALAEEILIRVGDGECVDVQPAVPREYPGEQVPGRSDRVDLHTRLDNGVARRDRARRAIDHRLVERVGDGAHQAPGRLHGQQGIGVQGDDVARIAELVDGAGAFGERTPCAGEHEAVELVELAAFALPLHPYPVTRVPGAPAMHPEERLAGVAAMTPIERRDSGTKRLQDRGVGRFDFPGAVTQPSEQAVSQLGVGIGEVVALELLQRVCGVVAVRHQERHAYRGAVLDGNAGAEIELGQYPGRQRDGHPPVDQDRGDGQCGHGHQCGGQ